MTTPKRIATLVLLLLACESPPPQEQRLSSNPGFEVSLMFKHDGCTVYRFADGGRYHYYVRCSADEYTATIDEHTEYCGKNCYRTLQDEIPTVMAGRP